MTWRNTYFLLEEVASHNTDQDCWLIIHGVVKNVSGLIEEFRRTDLVKPILREAGRDVSYWFELDEGQKPVLKTCLQPETGARVSMLPSRIPHESLFEPDVNWEPAISDGTSEWWRNEKYNVGMETVRPIKIRIMNTLIKRSVILKVCFEDTVQRIMEKYSVYNSKLSSYKMCYLRKPLRKDMNLSENNVTLEYNDFVEDFVPTIMLYYQAQSPSNNLIFNQ